MSPRKQTPDILAEILSVDNAVPLQPAPPAVPLPPPAPQTARRKASPKAAARPAPPPASKPAVKPEPASPLYEYLCVSFQRHQTWKARYVNGAELAHWMLGPELHDFVNQMGDDGWELCAASAGETLYGSNDTRQLFFKRTQAE